MYKLIYWCNGYKQYKISKNQIDRVVPYSNASFSMVGLAYVRLVYEKKVTEKVPE